MLHIILFLLKIIGCILLTILGLILILLLIVLFVPIRYDVSGSYYNTPVFTAKVSWLIGAVKASVEFKDNQLRIIAKLLWKTLIDTNKEENTQHKSVNESALDSISDDLNKSDMSNADDSVVSECDSETEAEAVQIFSDVSSEVSNHKYEKQKDSKLHRKIKDQEKKSFKEKKKHLKKSKTDSDVKKVSFIEKICSLIDSFIDRLEQFFEHTEEKLDDLTCKINKVEHFINAECTQKSIQFLKRMLYSILKHIAPNQVNGNIHFGMDKPSTTGKILGYASAFYPVYTDSINLIPDFEHKIIEGDLRFEGTIRLYIFIVWALKAILCKDIRKLIKYIKHLKK